MINEPSVFRLRGKIGGSLQFFELAPGEHLLGSARSSSIILKDPSISREHALLTVLGGKLEVRDLRSTNGTFVDGQRVRRSSVQAGSNLRLGRVLLRVEVVGPGDAQLAIDLEAETAPEVSSKRDASSDSARLDSSSRALESRSSTLLLPLAPALDSDAEHQQQAGLSLAALGDCLLQSTELSPALALIGQALGAQGCSVVAWEQDTEADATSGEQTHVLGAWGEVVPPPALEQLRQSERELGSGELGPGKMGPGEMGPQEPDLFSMPGMPATTVFLRCDKAHCEQGVASTPLAENEVQSAVPAETGKACLALLVRASQPLNAQDLLLIRTALPMVALWRQRTEALRSLIVHAPTVQAPTNQRSADHPTHNVAKGEAGHRLRLPEQHYQGHSPAMQALYREMETLLRGDLPVLIRGETGVGKEAVARALHQSSSRSRGPLVAINCAAIPGELLEAELFGIARGVATGVDARPGRLEQARGGTLFLDEVAEMSPKLQSKLLRALQEREASPLGGSSRPLDFRLLAATNAELEMESHAGLRPDLYFRLAGATLEVPPLRQRREDIPGLVEHFLRRFRDEAGIGLRGVSVAALQCLTRYPWPGNVRELEHELRRLVFSSRDGEVIESHRLLRRVRQLPAQPGTELDRRWVQSLGSLDLRAASQRVEELLLRAALRQTQGVKTKACELLGVSRNGLEMKLQRCNIDARELRRLQLETVDGESAHARDSE